MDENTKKILGPMFRPLSALRPKEVIPTGIKEIDDELIGIGGLPRGQAIEITSKEPHSGKTTLCLNIVKTVQNAGGQAFWFNVGEGLDLAYAKSIGIDEEELIVPTFSSAEDVFYQIKLLLAFNLADVIVLDTIAAMTTSNVQNRDETKKSQYENLDLAKTISTFTQDLQGGFKIKDPNNETEKGKNIISDVLYHKFVNGKVVEETELHKLEDKKAILIFINREMENIGVVYGPKTSSPGGKYKGNLITIKLILQTDKGDFSKEGGTPILRYRTMNIECTKNKAGGLPYRKAKIMMLPSGKIVSFDNAPKTRGRKKIKEETNNDSNEEN